MTRDDIIRIAREANIYASLQTGDASEWHILRDGRFAALVAQAEREECAALVASWNTAMTDKLAAAIRARGAA